MSSLWLVPPIVGQKVMLNPSSERYEAFNTAQAKNTDGVIYEVDVSYNFAFKDPRTKYIAKVAWESGNKNSYHVHDLLPISGTFFTIKRYDFKRIGEFISVLSPNDMQTVERLIINDGYKFEISLFDKEKRLDVLRKHVEHIDAELPQIRKRSDKQVIEHAELVYASILEEIAFTERAEAIDWLEEATKRFPKHQEQQYSRQEVRPLTEASSFNNSWSVGEGRISSSSFSSERARYERHHVQWQEITHPTIEVDVETFEQYEARMREREIGRSGTTFAEYIEHARQLELERQRLERQHADMQELAEALAWDDNEN